MFRLFLLTAVDFPPVFCYNVRIHPAEKIYEKKI